MGRGIKSSSCIICSLVLVSCVTAISRGRAPFAPASRPSSAARIMAEPPAACRFTMSAPRAARLRMAFFTVLGMSCNLRSRNTSCPRALISRTICGPSP